MDDDEIVYEEHYEESFVEVVEEVVETVIVTETYYEEEVIEETIIEDNNSNKIYDCEVGKRRCFHCVGRDICTHFVYRR